MPICRMVLFSYMRFESIEGGAAERPKRSWEELKTQALQEIEANKEAERLGAIPTDHLFNRALDMAEMIAARELPPPQAVPTKTEWEQRMHENDKRSLGVFSRIIKPKPPTLSDEAYSQLAEVFAETAERNAQMYTDMKYATTAKPFIWAGVSEDTAGELAAILVRKNQIKPVEEME